MTSRRLVFRKQKRKKNIDDILYFIRASYLDNARAVAFRSKILFDKVESHHFERTEPIGRTLTSRLFRFKITSFLSNGTDVSIFPLMRIISYYVIKCESYFLIQQIIFVQSSYGRVKIEKWTVSRYWKI